MGKKGSWFSTIKRIFKDKEKDKPQDLQKKKNKFPLFRAPSSIEKILGEADQLNIRPPISSESSKKLTILLEKPTSPTPKFASPRTSSLKVVSPRASSLKAVSPRASLKSAVSPRASLKSSVSPKTCSPKAPSPEPTLSEAVAPASYVSDEDRASESPAPPPSYGVERMDEIRPGKRAEPSFRDRHGSATKIQAVYRGYLARRSFRALKGIVRLQGVIRSQNVRRQTMNAMKQMQLVIRIQTQIRSHRMRMLENKSLQRQVYNIDKDAESSFSKTTLNQLLLESGENEEWDDSLLTKEEEEARLQKKAEAVMKRERAMAYAYSHQVFKSNSKPGRSSSDVRSNGYSWWWNWFDRQLPQTPQTNTTKNAGSMPPWPSSDHKMQSSNFTNHESATPRSSMSAVPYRNNHFQTPTRTPQSSSPKVMMIKNSNLMSPTSSAYDDTTPALKDNDSLMSCPAFTIPRYMTPTASAMAKVGPNSNPKERFPGTPDSKRRFSFPFAPSFKGGDSGSQEGGTQRHESPRSVRSSGVNSTASMPPLVGRKPFNRFV